MIRKCCLTVFVTLFHAGVNVFAQELSESMHIAYEACVKMSVAAGTGSQTGLVEANKIFKACDMRDFSILQCVDSDPLSLDGHFVFDDKFVDSLIAGRDVYRFAQRYALDRLQRGASSSGTIFSRNGAVRKLSSVKYTFVSRGFQEIAVVAEYGGLITLRIHDKSHGKWYNDIDDVNNGRMSRYKVFNLPHNERSLLEIEIINTSDRDISFIIISN